MTQLLWGRCGSLFWAGGDADEADQDPKRCCTSQKHPKHLHKTTQRKQETFSREDLDVSFRQALYKSSVAQTHSLLMKRNRKERWASLCSFTSFPGSGWTETRTCVTTTLPYSPKPAQQRSATKITNGQLPIIIMTPSSTEITQTLVINVLKKPRHIIKRFINKRAAGHVASSAHVRWIQGMSRHVRLWSVEFTRTRSPVSHDLRPRAEARHTPGAHKQWLTGWNANNAIVYCGWAYKMFC